MDFSQLSLRERPRSPLRSMTLALPVKVEQLKASLRAFEITNITIDVLRECTPRARGSLSRMPTELVDMIKDRTFAALHKELLVKWELLAFSNREPQAIFALLYCLAMSRGFSVRRVVRDIIRGFSQYHCRRCNTINKAKYAEWSSARSRSTIYDRHDYDKAYIPTHCKDCDVCIAYKYHSDEEVLWDKPSMAKELREWTIDGQLDMLLDLNNPINKHPNQQKLRAALSNHATLETIQDAFLNNWTRQLACGNFFTSAERVVLENSFRLYCSTLHGYNQVYTAATAFLTTKSPSGLDRPRRELPWVQVQFRKLGRVAVGTASSCLLFKRAVRGLHLIPQTELPQVLESVQVEARADSLCTKTTDAVASALVLLEVARGSTRIDARVSRLVKVEP